MKEVKINGISVKVGDSVVLESGKVEKIITLAGLGNGQVYVHTTSSFKRYELEKLLEMKQYATKINSMQIEIKTGMLFSNNHSQITFTV